MFTAEFDEKSWRQITHLLEFSGTWDHHMHDELADDLAVSAMEHFKTMLHVRPEHSGDLERSIKYDIAHGGNDFEISYEGLFYGLFMDTGNFPASTQIFRDNGKGFPISHARGQAPFMYSKSIHGMGSIHPDAPTHYSEKTVKWLADDEATKLASLQLQEFLQWVVI